MITLLRIFVILYFSVSSLLQTNSLRNFSLSLSTGGLDETKFYGQTFRMRIQVRAKTWEFVPSRTRYPSVLWKDDGTIQDNRRKLAGNYLTVYNVTQLDIGQYSLLDKNRIRLSSRQLDVIGELTVINLCKHHPCHFCSCGCFALLVK